jgi:hypothetical protein
MGNKGTKESKKNKGKGEVEQHDGKSEKEPTPTPATTNNGTASTEKGDEDVHASWNDRVLFTTGDDHKVTKDDFELLAVIGKGSFGKV